METSESQKPTMQLLANTNGLPTLRFGDTGRSVRVLQKLLRSNGYGVNVDGSFGALTESAVKAFQAQRGLTADGIVGPVTWNALAS